MNETAREKTGVDAFVERALVKTFSKVFIVDINTGEFEVYKNDGLLEDGFGDITDIYAYIEKLITDEIIYPEYATACRRFTNPEYVRKSIFSGNRRLVQSYRRRTAKGDKWITFAIVAGPDCAPDNPRVLYTWREADSDAITLLDTLPTISSLYDKLIRINLSNNTYEPVLVDADEQERLVGGVINMYEWWAGYSKDGNIAAEDTGVFAALTKAGSLQKRFAEDPTPVSFRYRRKVGDEYRWMQLQIAPSVEYSEENQIMLLSLKDVHEEYIAEMRNRQELIDNMHRDALTGLFNRLKFNADIDSLTHSGEPRFTCLYIDVNGLHELNNTLGHQKGDEMLCQVADTLREHFPDERVYRIGGDEFVVISTALREDAVENTVDRVRRALSQDNYEISAGIASGACGEGVEKLVMAAEQHMRDDKTAYYTRNGERRKGRLMNEKLEQMLVEKRDNERFLEVITRQFAGVYFVDLASDTFRHLCASASFSALAEETGGRFSAALRLYVAQFVQSECRDRFDAILDFDALWERLSRNEVVEVPFLKTDGSPMILRVLEMDRREKGKRETIWMVWKKY